MWNYIKYFRKIFFVIKKTQDLKTLYKIQRLYLSKGNIFNKILLYVKKTNITNLPIIGKQITHGKKILTHIFIKQKKKIQNKKNIINILKKKIDLSIPGYNDIYLGSWHPINLIIQQIKFFFQKLNFKIVISNEIENSYFNFKLLNIHKHHPAHTTQDTFWLNKYKLLRTHTTSTQIRYLKTYKPPIKIITFGNVFRKDFDKTHTPMFYQLEGCLIDKGINFTNVKYLIFNLIKHIFNHKFSIKFIPTYFPFTSPSAEVYIKTKKKKWLEILGCGIIHPHILKRFHINYKKYTGLAFGIGIERITMLKFHIKDIRILYKNDIKFLKQF